MPVGRVRLGGGPCAGQVVAGGLNWGTAIYGADVDWPLIRAWNTSQGEFFTEAEVRAGAKVCVLGAAVAEALFRTVALWGRWCGSRTCPSGCSACSSVRAARPWGPTRTTRWWRPTRR